MQNRLSIFETTIIGLFIGVIVASYEAFVTYSNYISGNILKYTTLTPLFTILTDDSTLLATKFAFTVIVFLIYGIIAGLLIKIGIKGYIILSIAILAVLAGIVEQINLPSNNFYSQDVYQANIIKSQHKKPQFFGFEAYGDLNNDNLEDVAFIIKRDDPDRGPLYYLSSALHTTAGNQGTNLVFLGNNVKPLNINIIDQKILIEYSKNSTTTKSLQAFLSGTDLVLATSTEI